MVRFLFVVGLLTLATPSLAESWFDLEQMKRVFNDVQEMPHEEAEYFTNFMASCGAANLLDEGLPRFYCRQAQLSYVMRFKRDRPLDRLLEEREKSAALLLANKKARSDDAATIRGAMDKVWGIDENLVDAVAARSAKVRDRTTAPSRTAVPPRR